MTLSIQDTQHDTQHNKTFIMPSAIMLCLAFDFYYAECHYAECHYADVIMLNVIMLSVIMLSVTFYLSGKM